jgi:hypothetical protein
MENQGNSGYSSDSSANQPKIVQKAPVSAITIPCTKDISLIEHTYRKNQIIATFEKEPPAEAIKELKNYIHKMGIGPIRVVKCECCNCDLTVQLWLAEDIHTIISGKTAKAGSGGDPQTVGGNYSLNFISKIPHYNWAHPDPYKPGDHELREKRPENEIKIAVLDTGLDRSIIAPQYIGTNLQNEPGSACFKNWENGWNFVEGNDDVHDDNPGLHGSLVTQFIINQFIPNPEKKDDSQNTLTIIPLKTHDQNGEGDLFNIFCAVYYAIAKGAKIINASWGFYYYDTPLLQPLDLLLKELKKQGILFVTAAGNKIDSDDSKADQLYYSQNDVDLTAAELRDLDIHQFLPACFSKTDSNVLTVTTTDGKEVSPQENYSNSCVDIGVLCDVSAPGDLGFRVPFVLTSGTAPVFGSSFATAIATGVIGANCTKAHYQKNIIKKGDFIDELERTQNSAGSKFCEKYPALKSLIRNGVGMQK